MNRAMMQAFFFPVAYRNGEKTARLEPGAIRLFVALKLLVKFQGETTLRIPFREQSKVQLEPPIDRDPVSVLNVLVGLEVL